MTGDDRYVLVEGRDTGAARAAEPIEAIDHEGAGPALVEERRGRGPQVLEPPRVRGAHRAGQGRHADEIPAIRRSRHTPGGDPEERGVGFREDPDERNRGLCRVQGEIAEAPL